jgi:SAM-dependent methyltransferase
MTTNTGGASFIELPGAGAQTYSDGPVEDALLAAFARGETAEEILAHDVSWPALYHLSAVRRNLLEWFPFDPAARVLEIGAGCGALTGLLCERTRDVTAIELSRKRAEIIRARHGDRRNLTIAVGNVRDLAAGERFDLVTLVGVLEYAPSFTPGADPAAALLEVVAEQLAPGGTLIVAIENRFGLKYWGGAAEDHTGAPFDGLEGYVRHGWVRTFGRAALEQLLRRAGFTQAQFHYPMPDYKLPESIFSERRPVEPGEVACPFPSFDRERLRLFDELAALDGIAQDGAFPFFANSFLVIARRDGAPRDRAAPDDVLLARYSRSRLPEYRIETRIVENGAGIVVKKRALEPAGNAHVAAIVANHQALQVLSGSLRVPPAALRGDVAEIAYVPGVSLESMLVDALLRRDLDGALRAVDLFAQLVRSVAVPSEAGAFGDDGGGPVLAAGIVDVNLDNLIRDAAGLWWLIDVEWRRPEPVSADFVIARGLEHVVWKRHALVTGVTEPQALFDRAGIGAGRRTAFQDRERSFQVLVRGEGLALAVDAAFERPSRTLASLTEERDVLAAAVRSALDAHSALAAGVAEVTEARARAESSCRETQHELERIKRSRAWRLVSLYYAAWRRLGRR